MSSKQRDELIDQAASLGIDACDEEQATEQLHQAVSAGAISRAGAVQLSSMLDINGGFRG